MTEILIIAAIAAVIFAAAMIHLVMRRWTIKRIRKDINKRINKEG